MPVSIINYIYFVIILLFHYRLKTNRHTVIKADITMATYRHLFVVVLIVATISVITKGSDEDDSSSIDRQRRHCQNQCRNLGCLGNEPFAKGQCIDTCTAQGADNLCHKLGKRRRNVTSSLDTKRKSEIYESWSQCSSSRNLLPRSFLFVKDDQSLQKNIWLSTF